MRLDARRLVALGVVGLVAGNVGRVPGLTASDGRGILVVLDLVLIPLWLVLLIELRSGRRRLVLDRLTAALCSFVAVASLSTALAWFRWDLTLGEGVRMTAYLLRWILYAGWFVLVVSAQESSREGPPDAAGEWVLVERGLIVLASFGILQSLFLPGFAQMLPGGAVWDPQGRRLVATLLDPNFVGGLLMVGALMALARESEGGPPSRGRLLLFGVALLLTLSRSAVLGLVAGLATMAVSRGVRARVVWLLGAFAMVVLPFATLLLAYAEQFNKLRIDASALQRLIPWMRSVILWRDHPVFGVGFNAVREAQRAYGWREVGGASGSFDGGLLFIAVMTGALGLSAFLWLLIEVGRGARTVWRSSASDASARAVAVGGWSATVGIATQSFFTNTLLLPFVMFPLWVLWGRIVRLARAGGGRGAIVPVALLLVSLGACDPCAGVVTCSAPSRTVTGTIVSRSTQAPLANVRVEIGDQAAQTDRRGQWTIPLPVSADSVQRVIVQSGTERYEVRVTLPVRTRAGEGTNLGTWYDRPVARFIVRPIYRGQVLPGASASFISRDGAVTIAGGANAQGFLHLFGDVPNAGSITGRLEITHPVIGTRRIDPFGLVTDHLVGIPRIRGDVPIDGSQRWGGEVIDRRIGVTAKAPGVGVRFERTGGVEIAPRVLTTTTDAKGVFFLDFEAFAPGEVRGDLTLFPAPPWGPVVYRDVRIGNHPPGSSGYLGLFAFGERWSWAVELWRHDMLVPVPGLPYRLVRTSGLPIAPASFSGVTDGGGRFYVAAEVPDSGVVVADLFVTPPGESERFVRRLSLRTSTSDQPQFAGVIGYGPALRYFLQVQDPSGTPVPNALVRFERTGGIPATAVTVEGRTDAAGRVFIVHFPATDGTLEGRVTITPGAPWPSAATYLFERVTLTTHDNGDVQVAPPLRLPPP